jgi:hypothetical protein
MENYKIKRNPKPLPDDNINRHKDFNKLLSTHKKLYSSKEATKPLYKNLGFMSMVTLIGIVLLMLVVDRSEEKETPTAKDSVAVLKADSGIGVQNQSQEQSNLNNRNISKNNVRVISDAENEKPISYEIFKIIPEKGAILYTKSGARLIVPVYAFFDKNKNVTKKEVTLLYRELTQDDVKLDKTGLGITFEIIADDSVSLTQPIVLEVTTEMKQSEGKLSKYYETREEWILVENEKIAYRYMIQANETNFPELTFLKELVWEIPEKAGKPSDFGYIFNRSWKNFSFDKKELFLKNTNSSFKAATNIAPLIGDKKENDKIVQAFFALYDIDLKKSNDIEARKQALSVIENWKNSAEGKLYYQWAKNSAGKNQFSSTFKISKLALNTFGIFGISNSTQPVTTKIYDRIIVLEKYPERNQDLKTDMDQH